MTQQTPGNRVLVVEDNEDIRQVVATFLRSHGFEVIEAADGLAGLECAARSPGLILLDVLLPKLDGIEVLKRLRADPFGSGVPVIMMSAVLQIRDLQAETSQLRVSGFLQKPFQLRALLEMVRAGLGQSAERSAEVRPQRPVARPGAADRARVKAMREPPVARADVPGQPSPDGVLRHRWKTVEPRGSIDATPVPFLFHGIFREQRTGRLRLASGGMERSIFFVGGVPVYAESSIPEETLGASLVRRNVIDQVQNARAVTEMTRTGRRFGEMLLKLGLIGPHQLFEELEYHLEEKAVGAFGWHAGGFEFEGGDDWKDDVIIARMHPGRIVLSGCQCHWTEAEVRRQVAIDGASHCVILADPPYDERQLALRPQEIRILQLARKGLPLSRIASETGGSVPVLPTLFGLFALEVVGFSNKAPVRQGIDIRALVDSALVSQPPAMPHREEAARQLLAEYLKLRTADHFALLGVTREANAQEIHAAFQDRQRRYHPDTVVGIDEGLVHEKLEELYFRVQTAYRTLIDPEARRRYVAGLDRKGTAVAAPYRPTAREEHREQVDSAADPEQAFQSGLALLRRGDFGGAKDAFARAHNLGFDPRALAYRAWADYLADPPRRRTDLEQELKKLAKEHDREPLYPYLLANLFQRENQAKRAEALYERTLEIDPRHIDAARQLRVLRMRQRAGEQSGLFDIFKKS
jgi:CheY-like chemotaxis protein/curved DNA-binding protein CbpA